MATHHRTRYPPRPQLGPVFRFQGPGFRVQGSGSRVQGSGSRVQGPGFRVQGPGFRFQGPEFRVQGPWFRVQGSGFRVQSPPGAAQHRARHPARPCSSVSPREFFVDNLLFRKREYKLSWRKAGPPNRPDDQVDLD